MDEKRTGALHNLYQVLQDLMEIVKVSIIGTKDNF